MRTDQQPDDAALVQDVQRVVEESRFTATAGDGLISVTVRASGRLERVVVDAAFVEQNGADAVGPGVLAAARAATDDGVATVREQLLRLGLQA